jgi:IclR family pca regulon transcriptional regulator
MLYHLQHIMRRCGHGSIDKPTSEICSMTDIQSEEKNVELLESLSKGLALLRLFATGIPAMTIQEVATGLNVTRAAARRLLLTLEHHGYVAQDGRTFSITPRVIELGYAYFASMDLPTLARPAMRELADKVNETCSLGVLDGAYVAMIAREEPERLLRIDLAAGRRLPAYVHSLGRQLLAYLDEERLQHYLQSVDLRKITPLTVTSAAALEKNLKQIRREGYCVVMDEILEGIGGISVPVRKPSGEVVAAICVSLVLGTKTRERLVKDYLAPLQQTAQAIETMLSSVHA